MGPSELRLIKRSTEFRPRREMFLVPHGTRGVYVLMKYRPILDKYDVVYVGMARGLREGIRARLKVHARSKRTSKLWTHFSIFEVWDNISEGEIRELEGLFRHIYRRDTRANRLNRQRGFNPLRKVRIDLKKWNHAS